MTCALSPNLGENQLEKLIVVDIAPSIGALSPEFQGYVKTMQKIEESKVSSRKEAQSILAEFESVSFNLFFRHFYLTSLGSNDSSLFND